MEAYVVILTLMFFIVSGFASWWCLTQRDPPPTLSGRLKLRRLSDDVTLMYRSPR